MESGIDTSVASPAEFVEIYVLFIIDGAGNGSIPFDEFETQLDQCAIGRRIFRKGLAEDSLEVEMLEVKIDRPLQELYTQTGLPQFRLPEVEMQVGLFPNPDPVNAGMANLFAI